ncbi:MAG: phosphoribosyltransferase [Gammaproteobacteria bacterium]|nr:MAG: phosphoribosyltransferase [Gammaproteobacteria bacterium]
MTKVNNWLKSAQIRLWPQCCQLCGDGPLDFDSVLCDGCLNDMPWNTHCCPVCALPLHHDAICGRCLRKPPAYHRALATFSYRDPISHIVHGLKFGQRLYYGRFLGEQLAETVLRAEHLIMPDVLIPMPLHRKRMIERGYNQAHEIARPVARRLELPIALDIVARQRETAEQSRLNALQRCRNLKDAFCVTGSASGLHVAIVDDVMTTGATVGELARVLVVAGVRRIDVWLGARAPLAR